MPLPSSTPENKLSPYLVVCLPWGSAVPLIGLRRLNLELQGVLYNHSAFSEVVWGEAGEKEGAGRVGRREPREGKVCLLQSFLELGSLAGVSRYPAQEHSSKGNEEKKETSDTSRRHMTSGGYVCAIHYCQQHFLVLFLVTRVILTPYFLLEQANLWRAPPYVIHSINCPNYRSRAESLHGIQALTH